MPPLPLPRPDDAKDALGASLFLKRVAACFFSAHLRWHDLGFPFLQRGGAGKPHPVAQRGRVVAFVGEGRLHRRLRRSFRREADHQRLRFEEAHIIRQKRDEPSRWSGAGWHAGDRISASLALV